MEFHLQTANHAYGTLLASSAKDWMQGIIDALHLHRRLVGIHSTHPDYPLPAEFPFGPGISENLKWIQISDDGREQVRKSFHVKLGLKRGRMDRMEPLVWALYSGNINIGSLRVEPQVYAVDKQYFDPLFILENLQESIALETPLIVSTPGLIQPMAPETQFDKCV